MLFYHPSDIQALKYKPKRIWGEYSEILCTDEGNWKNNHSRLRHLRKISKSED